MFWKVDILLQAWAVCYRIFSSRLPKMIYWHQINVSPSPQCRLCQANNHFLDLCSTNARYGNLFLILLYWHNLYPTHIFTMLHALKAPCLFPPSQIQAMFILVLTNLWLLCPSHRQSAIQNTPFLSFIKNWLTCIHTLKRASIAQTTIFIFLPLCFSIF